MTVARAFALALVAAAGASAPAQAQTWEFEVRLDGRPIGMHRFVVGGTPAAREVESTARFDVKLLGVTVYRYRHEARERWRGDCLQEIHARTDDAGEPALVDQRRETAGAGGLGDADCVMSYAYWNPALVRQARLLNPQTGQVDAVRVERMSDAQVAVGGRDVDAARWRITATSATARQDLSLWLDRADGRWIGLDAAVGGGRVLTYRLP